MSGRRPGGVPARAAPTSRSLVFAVREHSARAAAAADSGRLPDPLLAPEPAPSRLGGAAGPTGEEAAAVPPLVGPGSLVVVPPADLSKLKTPPKCSAPPVQFCSGNAATVQPGRERAPSAHSGLHGNSE